LAWEELTRRNDLQLSDLRALIRDERRSVTDEVVPVLPGDDAGVERVEQWLQAFAVSHDPALREQIILAYLGLADRLADRYHSSRGTSREDLTQTARAALIAAVDRYDPTRERGFVPFAVACVVGELKRYLRDASWRMHIPRPLKERGLKLCKAVDELPQRLGRSPTLAELAAHLEVTEEEALEAREVAGTRVDCSLDAPLNAAEDVSLAHLVAAPAAHEEREDLLVLPALLTALPEVERQVVLLRFFADLSQYEIAARVGCSQMHVSRLLRQAIARMRVQLLPSSSTC
jgi:RNA polymerase sigma-B factor